MSSFNFILTEKCDWDCPYCYFTGIKQKEPDIEVFKEHLPYIKEIIDELGDLVTNIDIQGGEVGTMNPEILNYFFDTIRKPIVVSTNGLFLERRLYSSPKINPYISKIMHHVTQDFRSMISFNSGLDISRGMVHDNVDEMVRFIKKYPNVIFDYIEFEFDINKPREMDVDMYQDLYEKINHLDNITDNAKWIINQRRLYENPNLRKNCRNYNQGIVIDLVNARICLCQRQMNVNIPLTKENLIYRLRNLPKDVFDGGNCSSCTRLYTGKMSGNVIENYLKIKRYYDKRDNI